MTVRVLFVRGTLELRYVEGEPREPLGELVRAPELAVFDGRSDCFRAPALRYADLIRRLTRAQIPFVDEARAYAELAPRPPSLPALRDYQAEAVDAWTKARGRGVIVLPTGSGKTLVAIAAIAHKRRSTLVLAPTLDLVRQWAEALERAFGGPIGIVGGGSHQVESLTVTTYDSAHLHMDHLGARFGLLVCDECHHLPGESYQHAALASIAPYRLGLTATPERPDGLDAKYAHLLGPIVYRKDIVELTGAYLAPYETHRILLPFSERERAEYTEARSIYRDFVVRNGIRMGGLSGFREFLQRASQSEDGIDAFRAFRDQRKLAFRTEAKLQKVAELLDEHAGEKTIIFTSDNATVYEISIRMLVPVITHKTGIRERIESLAKFRTGIYTALATSRVLNEGVDIPEASVAIVVSGSGTVREHVQRLGRVLRKVGTKQAILYELVTEDTSEVHTSERRREHSAYR
jgi:superfamily II DNA or RNA helicase